MGISTTRRCTRSVGDDTLNTLIREVQENQQEDKEKENDQENNT